MPSFVLLAHVEVYLSMPSLTASIDQDNPKSQQHHLVRCAHEATGRDMSQSDRCATPPSSE